MSTETSKLPEKPSGLILLALKDLKSAEASEKYKISMVGWHDPLRKKDKFYKCKVCLAGSVIAFSLGADINNYFSPLDFPEEEGKLRSLEYFRVGNLHSGLREFYQEDRNYEDLYKFDIPSYYNGREGFYEAMTELADYLKKNGY